MIKGPDATAYGTLNFVKKLEDSETQLMIRKREKMVVVRDRVRNPFR